MTNDIRLTLQFNWPEVLVINIFAILQVFLVGLGNLSEFFVCLFFFFYRSELRDLKEN